MQGMRNVFALNETGGLGVFLGSVTCRRLMEFNETPALDAESKACGDTVGMVPTLSIVRFCWNGLSKGLARPHHITCQC